MNPFILYSMLQLSYAQVINRADWPEALKAPPVNQSWTDRVLKDANIPQGTGRGYITSSSDTVGCNDANTWAFSYDDGPGQFTVNDALIPLKERNIKATFYVVGHEVVNHPEVLKQMYDEGHSIGIHGWSHSALTSLTNAEIIAELVWSASLIHRLIGVVPTHVRPPYMDIDERVRAVIQATGFKISLWNFDPKDAESTEIAVTQTFRNHLNQPPQGTISLQHDLVSRTAKQIAPTLDLVRQTSYKFATVPECAGFPAYGNPLINEILGLPSTGTNPGVQPDKGVQPDNGFQPDKGSVKQQAPPNASYKLEVVSAVVLLLILNIFF